MKSSIITITISIALLATIGNAQESATKESLEKTLDKGTKVIAELKEVAKGKTFLTNQVVKNKPYSVEAISESVQVLEDGNRITRSTTVKMFRDSEGRTRREGSSNTGNFNSFPSGRIGTFLGVLSSNTISIYDPVNAVRYSLYPKTKKFRRYEVKNQLGVAKFLLGNSSFPKKIESKQLSELSPEERAKMNKEMAEMKKKYAKLDKKFTKLDKEFNNVVIMGSVANLSFKSDKSESLGTKVIEGLLTEGTRSVKTIEAGAIGNELPIEITYEKWYSKDLEMIVYSRKYDPRSGEQIYRLTNIDQTEPDSSLFTVPSDYKLVDKKSLTFRKK